MDESTTTTAEPTRTTTTGADGAVETTVTVEGLRTGSVSLDRTLASEEDTRQPMPETGWFRPTEARRWVSVSAYLLTHPVGTVLVDTGWHRDVRTDARGHLWRVLSSLHKA